MENQSGMGKSYEGLWARELVGGVTGAGLRRWVSATRLVELPEERTPCDAEVYAGATVTKDHT